MSQSLRLLKVDRYGKWTKFDEFKYQCRRWFNHTKLGLWYGELQWGILSIRQWYKVVWKDRNYDFAYTYEILLHKLETLRDRFIEENAYKGNRNDPEIKQVNYAIMLCKRCIDENNDDLFEVGASLFDRLYKNCGTQPTDKKLHAHYDKLRHKNHLEWNNYEYQTRRLLFKYLGKNSRGWWT